MVCIYVGISHYIYTNPRSSFMSSYPNLEASAFPLQRKPTADKDLPCSNYIVIRITNIAILIMMTIVAINNIFKNNDNNGNHDNIGIKINGNIYI